MKLIKHVFITALLSSVFSYATEPMKISSLEHINYSAQERSALGSFTELSIREVAYSTVKIQNLEDGSQELELRATWNLRWVTEARFLGLKIQNVTINYVGTIKVAVRGGVSSEIRVDSAKDSQFIEGSARAFAKVELNQFNASNKAILERELNNSVEFRQMLNQQIADAQKNSGSRP